MKNLLPNLKKVSMNFYFDEVEMDALSYYFDGDLSQQKIKSFMAKAVHSSLSDIVDRWEDKKSNQ
jgi:hypothetical protein